MFYNIGGTDHTVAVLNNAAALGDIDLFEHLICRGANLSRSIPLHHACRCENPEKSIAMISHLIEKHELDVNSSDLCGGLREFFDEQEYYGPPLRWAVAARNTAAVEELLRRGASIDHETVLHAIRVHPTPALEMFLRAGTDPTRALCYVMYWDYIEALQLCMDYGGDVEVAEKDDATWIESGEQD